jgi:A118 family predicted phage portal protein
MALPEGGNVKWPPEAWEAMYGRYAEWSAWYSGDPNVISEVHASQVYTPTPRGRFWAREVREERRVMLHVPLAGDIATVSADLLFSEPAKILIPEAHEEKAPAGAKETQEYLDKLVNELAQVHSRLLEAAESAAAMGGVFIRPAWDVEVADHSFLSLAQADNAIPEFRWGVLVAVTLWRTLSSDSNTIVYRHLERYEPGGLILHGLYRGTSDKLGTKLDLGDHPETEDLQDVVATELDGLAIRYVPNMMPNPLARGSALGKSDYSGVEGLMDALDEVYTSWIRDIRIGQGRIIVPEQFLEKATTEDPVTGLTTSVLKLDIDKEVFAALNIDPLSAEKSGITINQFNIRTEEHRDTALELIDRIVSRAGYSPQSFGLKIEGRAESGTALRIRDRKSLTTKQKKERYFKGAVEDALQMMLTLDKRIFNAGIEVFRPRLDFEDSIVPDPMEVAQAVDMVNRAQAASVKTKVKMVNPGWSAEEVDAEVKAILAEQGQYVENAMQVGQV